jgi:peptidoglycan/xylan/chitin deacetylase (PgdA/CDA1 family)
LIGRVSIFFAILFLTAVILHGGGVGATEEGIGIGGVDLLLVPTLSFEPVRLFTAGNPHVKRVALTFDDSPNPYYTEQLLRILREKNVKATFFCMGNKCQLYPDLLIDVLRDGHDIGNHSYSHPKLVDLATDDWQEEILYTNRIISRVLGYECRLFRPPHGRATDDITDFVFSHGMTTCWWTVNTGDYLEPAAETILKKVTGNISSGGIVLMHDGTDSTLEALPLVIDKLAASGYEFVTMSELIGGKIVF